MRSRWQRIGRKDAIFESCQPVGRYAEPKSARGIFQKCHDHVPLLLKCLGSVGSKIYSVEPDGAFGSAEPEISIRPLNDCLNAVLRQSMPIVPDKLPIPPKHLIPADGLANRDAWDPTEDGKADAQRHGDAFAVGC